MFHISSVARVTSAVCIMATLSSCFLTAGVTDSATAFYALVKDNNLQAAYNSTAKDFQKATSLEDFKQFMKASGLDKYSEASWTTSSINNDQGHVEGTVTTSEKTSIAVTMDFIKEDGVWKVLNIKPVQSGAVSPQKTTPATLPETSALNELVGHTMNGFAQAISLADFTQFHTTVAELWKPQVTADKFKEIFKQFIDQKIDLSYVMSSTPTFSGTPSIDDQGILKIEGSYEGTPAITFSLKYYTENNAWKLVGIDVKTKQ